MTFVFHQSKPLVTLKLDFVIGSKKIQMPLIWTRDKGSTPTWWTGPSEDHTTGTGITKPGKSKLKNENLSHVFPFFPCLFILIVVLLNHRLLSLVDFIKASIYYFLF